MIRLAGRCFWKEFSYEIQLGKLWEMDDSSLLAFGFSKRRGLPSGQLRKILCPDMLNTNEIFKSHF